MAASNTFLTRINNALRKPRAPSPASVPFSTYSNPGEDHLYRIIWFRTRGCRFDYWGECTMCNYGVSSSTSPGEMITAVRDALATLNVVPEVLIISPSGSMFDEWEVPAEARRGILQLANNYPSKIFACESRAECVTDNVVDEYARILDKKVPVIEIGLESADPWILRNCINKSTSLEEYVRAIGVARSHNVETSANVLLGHAFMTESEAIDDAVASVAWALAQGTDRCVLFPTHVKPWTLIHWLWEHGMYEPPSLWSLVEVLRRLGQEQAEKVYISWYRPHYGDASTSYPTTCPDCRDSVLNLLDEYRRSRDYEVVKRLISQNCRCKPEWRAKIEKMPDDSLVERLERIYEIIGPAILTPETWQHERSDILLSR